VTDYSIFPVIDATLNGTSAVLIATGVALVRRGHRQAHRWVMIAAVVTSSLFLISYLYYHAHVGNVRFPAHGWPRPLYFTILISHTLLAVVVVPLVIVTFARGLRGRFDRHRASARWTYPVWMYVSVTGVVIYLMLYQFFAPNGILANLR
jgi:putative membrane protein